MCTFPAKKNAACAQRLYCVSAEAYVACTQTMFYFSFLSFGKHRRSRAQGEHPYPFELAVNKSPSVYFLSRALDGQRVCEQLKHTQRGSVKRYELGRGHFFCGSISFPPWSNTSHKRLEQVVDSNIFKPGGAVQYCRLLAIKHRRKKERNVWKPLTMTVNPELRNLLLFHTFTGQKISLTLFLTRTLNHVVYQFTLELLLFAHIFWEIWNHAYGERQFVQVTK